MSGGFLSLTAFQAEGCGIALAGDEFYSFPSVLHTGARSSAQYNDVGGRPYRHFDRSEAEWRNLTPPWYRKHWGGRSLDSEFHRSGFPLTPIPAHPPARDDDIGERPSRHFDRSEAEWRNLPL